jgi:hypothetical protein
MSNTHTEEFNLSGEALLKKVKEIIQQGNVRRIIIKDKSGKPIAEFPLTIGVVGVLVAPVLAAIGVIAALVTECTLVVEHQD